MTVGRRRILSRCIDESRSMDGESIEMRFLRGDVDRTVGTATGPFFFLPLLHEIVVVSFWKVDRI